MRHAPLGPPTHRPSATRLVTALLLGLMLVTAAPVAAAPTAPAAKAAVITTWNQHAVARITATGGSPTNFNYFAFVHLAMYNAVVGITGEYELYKWHRKGPSGASPEAAAAAAAHRVLVHYFGTTPEIIADLDAKLAASLDARAGRQAGEQGSQVRRPRREPDHCAPRERRSQRRGDGPGRDRPGPLEAGAGDRAVHQCMDGWCHPARDPVGEAVRSRTTTGDQLEDVRPGVQRGPRLRGHRTWTRSGRKRRPRPPSSSRTQGSVRCRVPFATSRLGTLSTSTTAPGCSRPRTPPSRTARSRCGTPSSDTCGGGRSRPSATQMATATTGRPRSRAGRRGSRTPPYPDWPSGLCSVVGAVATTLQRLNGDGTLDLTITSAAAGETRNFATKAKISRQAVDARVWSGIHFRTADEVSIAIGSRVANWTLNHYFQPTD